MLPLLVIVDNTDFDEEDRLLKKYEKPNSKIE